MPNNIEWHVATERPVGYTPAELNALAHEADNDEGFIGVGSGNTMLYGTVSDIIGWFEQALVEVKRVHALEIVRKRTAAEATIYQALSRDDDMAYGSEFEDKVQVIRSLNQDSLPEANDGKPDPLNFEYCRGQVEFLMDTTAWRERPEKEDVWLYIFGQEWL